MINLITWTEKYHSPKAEVEFKCLLNHNGPGDLGSIPGRVIPKTQKMVLDASLLSTQHYKVRIKGKVEQSRKGVAPSPTHWCSSYRKGSLRVTLDYGRQLYFTYLLYIYIYIYIYIYQGFLNSAYFSLLLTGVGREKTLHEQRTRNGSKTREESLKRKVLNKRRCQPAFGVCYHFFPGSHDSRDCMVKVNQKVRTLNLDCVSVLLCPSIWHSSYRWLCYITSLLLFFKDFGCTYVNRDI